MLRCQWFTLPCVCPPTTIAYHVSVLECAKSRSGLNHLLRNDLQRNSIELTSTRDADKFDQPVDVFDRGNEEEPFATFDLKNQTEKVLIFKHTRSYS